MTIPRKLYNIMQGEQPVASLLTATGVLAHFPHKTLKDWMKYAQIGQWHGVAHPLHNDVRIKRIQ